MKKVVLILTAAVLICFVAAFFLVSFNISVSETPQNYSIASSKGDTTTQAVRVPDATGIYIVDTSRFSAALKARVSALQNQAFGLGQIQWLSSAVDQAGTALMHIEVVDQNIQWTPIYCTAELHVVVWYSSIGDISFRHTNPTSFSATGNQPALQLKGDYAVSDITKGLISRPGYENALADKVARTILESIQKQSE
jgi:hypothetical protein